MSWPFTVQIRKKFQINETKRSFALIRWSTLRLRISRCKSHFEWSIQAYQIYMLIESNKYDTLTKEKAFKYIHLLYLFIKRTINHPQHTHTIIYKIIIIIILKYITKWSGIFPLQNRWSGFVADQLRMGWLLNINESKESSQIKLALKWIKWK